MLLAFYKPYGVVSQFTPPGNQPALPVEATLSGYALPKGVYACGRLDHDSEGLLLLTDDGALQHRITDPAHDIRKTYWSQVEGVPTVEALRELAAGVRLKDGLTRPCRARLLRDEPALPPRVPPIRFRKSIPTAWIELTLGEGRNRQVRRMTAAVGFPTLRLVRYVVGAVTLGELAPGTFRKVAVGELAIA